MSGGDTLRALLAAGSLAAHAESSAQVARLSAAELYDSCLAYRADPDGARGRECHAYVRGVVDASRSPDAGWSSRAESFRERALRTRAGARAASLPRYCLAASLSVDRLVGDLLTHRVADPDGTSASTAVDWSLRRIGGCGLR